MSIDLPRYQKLIVKIQEDGLERRIIKLLEAKLDQIKDDFLSIDPNELAAHQKAGQFLQDIVADLHVVPLPDDHSRTRGNADTADDE